jgi:hypothetical protein
MFKKFLTKIFFSSLKKLFESKIKQELTPEEFLNLLIQYRLKIENETHLN